MMRQAYSSLEEVRHHLDEYYAYRRTERVEKNELLLALDLINFPAVAEAWDNLADAEDDYEDYLNAFQQQISASHELCGDLLGDVMHQMLTTIIEEEIIIADEYCSDDDGADTAVVPPTDAVLCASPTPPTTRDPPPTECHSPRASPAEQSPATRPPTGDEETAPSPGTAGPPRVATASPPTGTNDNDLDTAATDGDCSPDAAVDAPAPPGALAPPPHTARNIEAQKGPDRGAEAPIVATTSPVVARETQRLTPERSLRTRDPPSLDHAHRPDPQASKRKKLRKVHRHENGQQSRPRLPQNTSQRRDNDLADVVSEWQSAGDVPSALDILSHFCILPQWKRQNFGKVFSKLDGNKGYLTTSEVAAGLHVVNNNLISDGEVEYVMQVLELLHAPQAPATNTASDAALGPEARVGAEVFAITAALSERVVALDPVVRNCISTMDFEALQKKMRWARALFVLNSTSQGRLPREELDIILQSGRFDAVSRDAVIEKLVHRTAGDVTFLDYLTYIPLFINIHNDINFNPFERALRSLEDGT
eukprot:m.890207 g.890207  ORF g.890207 m.890207 type:complete len:536 (-) comp23649_c0_seq5:211-1818(-)